MVSERDRIANEVLFGALERRVPEGRGLVAADGSGDVLAWLSARGAQPTPWDRRTYRFGQAATPLPPDGPFDWGILRLSKSREELEMSMHLLASRLAPGAQLWVYGAKDEGILPAARQMGELWGTTTTLKIKARCRVLRAVVDHPDSLRGGLADWRQVWPLRLSEEEGRPGPRDWVSYPGLFGAAALESGAPDPGTALLLASLPNPPAEARILDFGGGSGIITAALLDRAPGCHLTLLDNDSLALEAARENVPGAERLLAASVRDAPGPFDWIVANPPYHKGKGEDLSVVEELILGARDVMTRKGRLFLVVQRRLPVDKWLSDVFGSVRMVTETGTYRVWEAR